MTPAGIFAAARAESRDPLFRWVAALCCVPLVVAEADILSPVRLFLFLYFGCYKFPCFLMGDRAVQIVPRWNILLLGIGLNAIAALVIARFEQAPYIFIAFTVAIGCVGAYRMRSRDDEVCTSDERLPVSAILVIAPLLFFQLYACFRSGSGAYPKAFFNIETSYYLQFAHSFATDWMNPPENLAAAGDFPRTHFGVAITTAILAKVGGIGIHSAFALILWPLFWFSILASLHRILRRNSTAAQWLWLGFGVALYVRYLSRGAWPDAAGSALAGDWGQAFSKFMSTLEGSGHNFMQAGVLAGLAFSSVLFVTIFNWSESKHPWPRPFSKATWTSLHSDYPARAHIVVWCVSLAALVTFKLTTAFGVALGLGTWAIAHFFLTRDHRPLYLGACAAGATLLALVIYQPSVSVAIGGADPSSAAEEASWTLKSFVYAASRYGFHIAIFVAALLAATRIPCHAIVRGLCLALPPLLAKSIFTDSADASAVSGSYASQLDQLATIALTTLPLLGGILVMNAVAQSQSWKKAMILGAALFSIAPFFVQNIIQSALVVARPELVAESSDNRSLAEVLAPIPTDGTMLVMNDLTAYANTASRPRRDYHTPALFGHRCYTSDTSFARTEVAKQRGDLQEKLFQAAEFSPLILQKSREEGWTHLLIKKVSPHPAKIPLPLIAENEHYATYSFGEPE